MKKLLLWGTLLLLIACSSKEEAKKEREWRYLYDLGMSSFYAKNYSEAIAHLYKASKIAPEEPTIWNALGLTYMEVEEYTKAERAFKRALKVNPQFSEAKMNLGILYFKSKNYREAIKFLDAALSDETFDKKHLAFYYLAKVYKELGDRKKYLEYLRKATAYNPMFLEAQLELGSAYMDMKLYDKAEKVFNSLLSNNIKTPEIFLNLAKLYYETDRLEEAKGAISRVLEDRQTTNLQKTQAYELLSKILIKEQRKLLGEIEKKKRKQPPKEKKEKKPKKQEHKQKKYGVQLAAFSTEERAKEFINRFKKKGIKDLRIVEISGIFKVIYGSFATREEAQRELERLKNHDIYGFIVEVE